MLLSGVKPVAAAAVAAVLASVAPMLALCLGRLPLPRMPDDIEPFRANEQPSLGAEVIGRTTYAQMLLTALLVALGLVVLASAVTLAASGGPWEAGLAALVGVAWVQRSRSYAGRRQRVVLAGFGVVTLLTAAAWLIATHNRTLLPAAGAVLLIAAVVCLVSATRVAKGVRSPYWSRLLDVSEFPGAGGIGAVRGDDCGGVRSRARLGCRGHEVGAAGDDAFGLGWRPPRRRGGAAMRGPAAGLGTSSLGSAASAVSRARLPSLEILVRPAACSRAVPVDPPCRSPLGVLFVHGFALIVEFQHVGEDREQGLHLARRFAQIVPVVDPVEKRMPDRAASNSARDAAARPMPRGTVS
ncbi:hypothetical protein AB0F91_41060 [Amycolatopsis sp. NPDC023774]|uniref:hypothetical protein n=1 Tax=Amycolatopsis sp. NPDC023774 TaxID=3155015 RepID=UPI0033EC8904